MIKNAKPIEHSAWRNERKAMTALLPSRVSCEKIHIWIGKVLLVVQGTKKFPRLGGAKSAGCFPSPKDPPGIRRRTLACLI
jgi:hypothetical protein